MASLITLLVPVVLLVVGAGQALGQEVSFFACNSTTRPYIFTDYTASFIPPNFPSDYPNNANCQWLIISQEPGGFVELDFTEITTESIYDVISVYDGNTTSSPILTAFDGTWNPAPKGVLSTGSSMLVTFTSDASITAKGFLATYSSVPWFEVKDGCSRLSRPLLLTSGTGQISSPNFSNSYFNHANCQWLIESQVPGGIVSLEFLNFFTENFVDIVYLYDGPTTTSRLISSFSGPVTPTDVFQTTQMYMLVRFLSNANAVRSGWRASFDSLPAP